MPRERLSMRKVREILTLKWERDLSERQVANSVGVGREGGMQETCLGGSESVVGGDQREGFGLIHDGKLLPQRHVVQNEGHVVAEVIARSRLGGLHHRYEWRVAA